MNKPNKPMTFGLAAALGIAVIGGIVGGIVASSGSNPTPAHKVALIQKTDATGTTGNTGSATTTTQAPVTTTTDQVTPTTMTPEAAASSAGQSAANAAQSASAAAQSATSAAQSAQQAQAPPPVATTTTTSPSAPICPSAKPWPNGSNAVGDTTICGGNAYFYWQGPSPAAGEYFVAH